MFEQLYIFFINLFVWDLSELDFFGDIEFEIGGQIINMPTYLSLTATFISLTIIIVLCCMFVYKIIKLIGGLIR